MLLQRLDRARPELLVVELAARRADDPEALGQQPVGMEPVERGQQHAMRKVAGRAEQQQGRNLVAGHAFSLARLAAPLQTMGAQLESRNLASRMADGEPAADGPCEDEDYG